MSREPRHPVQAESLATRIRQATGIAVSQCYQCGKCAAGCPVVEEMDLAPCQSLRMLQLGFPALDLKVLQSEALWLCVACETCHSRCPQEVPISRIMDFLRQEAMAQGLAHPRSRDIQAFHRAFLDSVAYTGRLFELGMVADYKWRTRHFLQDVGMAPGIYLRGKLELIPHRIKGAASLKRIFARTLGRKR